MTPDAPQHHLASLIRSLLLPVSEQYLGAAADAAAQVLGRRGVPAAEQAATLEREWRSWTLEDKQSPLLTELVRAILTSESRLPKRFVKDFFISYEKAAQGPVPAFCSG